MPTAVLLTPAPQGFPAAATQQSIDFGAALADQTGIDGRHVIFSDPRGEHRVLLVRPGPDQPLAVAIPLDEDFSLRLAGALRFQHWLMRRPAGRLPRSMLLTARHRARLMLMLRACDMRQDGATYREIAADLFGAKAVAEHGWKTLPVRGRTIRLVEDANTMIGGGYLNLLRGK